MGVLKVHEKTGYFEAMETRNRWINNIGPYIRTRNSRFITLSFRKGITLDDMPQLIQTFRERLVEASGIHPSRLYTAALYLSEPVPHVHMIAVSDKDRKTGRTITNMPRETIQALFTWWEGQAGNTGKWEAPWDVAQLFGYFTGVKNTSRTDQRWAEEIHNEKFLKRLARRMERRSYRENIDRTLSGRTV